MCLVFVLPDFHFHTDSDGDEAPAEGEKTPAGVAKEVTATLRTLKHYVCIQEHRQRWNKENYLSACLEVLTRMGKLADLPLEERQACEAAKAIVDGRQDGPSPFDATSLFYNAASAPAPAEDE